MRRWSFGSGFLAGFACATVLGLTVVQWALHESWETNIDSDVHRTLEGALQHIEHTATQGDCERAAAQLRLLNDRFAKYRAGGPTPAEWWQEIVELQPARPDDSVPGAR